MAKNETIISNNGSNVSWDSKNETLRKRMTVSNNGAWNGESVTLEVEIDFKGVELPQVYSWAGQTLIINLQQGLRKCDISFVKDLAKSVYKRKATAMGVLDDPMRAARKLVENAESMSPLEVENIITALQARLDKLNKARK